MKIAKKQDDEKELSSDHSAKRSELVFFKYTLN